MPPVPESVRRQADLLRVSGNEYFNKGRIGAAIDAYTESIVLHPCVPACWTNRALCFRKKREWHRVEEDCKKAIALDARCVKGHYLLGLALLERQEYGAGIEEMERAFDLARNIDPAGHMVEEIRQKLANSKYMNWEQESTIRLWKVQKSKETCIDALTESYLCSPRNEEYSDEALTAHMDRLALLSEITEKVGTLDKPAEVPDHLCCKITFDIFQDPVITPGGITYERTAILEHLHKVGRFDPVTRHALEEHQLVPNLAIKEAVLAFLEDHGWGLQIFGILRNWL